jgi:hypothetical protein
MLGRPGSFDVSLSLSVSVRVVPVGTTVMGSGVVSRRTPAETVDRAARRRRFARVGDPHVGVGSLRTRVGVADRGHPKGGRGDRQGHESDCHAAADESDALSRVGGRCAVDGLVVVRLCLHGIDRSSTHGVPVGTASLWGHNVVLWLTIGRSPLCTVTGRNRSAGSDDDAVADVDVRGPRRDGKHPGKEVASNLRRLKEPAAASPTGPSSSVRTPSSGGAP